MSTVQKVNFEPCSDMLSVTRRDFTLADKTLVQPSNAVCLVDGEWMTINSSYQALRASDVTSTGALNSSNLVYPLWAERGRYDLQVLGKAPLLWMGTYEVDTRIFDASATVTGGAAISAVGQGLKVATIVIGSRKYTGLVGIDAATNASPVVGYVTRLPASNGGKLRFRNIR